jgi:alpha-galactosidase
MTRNRCTRVGNGWLMFMLAAAIVSGGRFAGGEEEKRPDRKHHGDECAAVQQWVGRSMLGEPATVGAPAARGPADGVPFSFVYGGKPSSQLLDRWKRNVSHEPQAGNLQRHTVTWTDEHTGLLVVCEATVFSDFPAVEWVLRLKNTSDKDTPIIENIQPLDLKIGLNDNEPVVFHHAKGSTMSSEDYETIDAALQPGQNVTLPRGDLPSQTYLPYFNLQWLDGGLVGAIGWTGQWALSAQRRSERQVLLRAGQQHTHLKLLPGESIRTPRVLLVRWQGGDPLRGHNLLRRLLLAHYVARLDGKPVTPLTSQNDWFVMSEGNDTTERNQLEIIPGMRKMDLEVYWLDAGWYEGGWAMGNGSWFPKKDHFPRGLRPLGNAAHHEGLKFLVWFEPERVCANSLIDREHSAWLLPPKKEGVKFRWSGIPGRLFNLGDPQARQWMTDYLSKCISDWKIDIYRQDRNFHPWYVWRDSDAPDRQGITEIRHVEGLYAMWDDLRKRHPRLVIDNANWRCTGPDLEMVMRSAGSWTCSEAAGGGTNAMFNQQQLMGLSLYVPVHGSLVFGVDPYLVRSVARLGVGQSANTRSPQFSAAQMKLASAEVKSLRELYLGDYYPLVNGGLSEQLWCGWQFDRPDLGRGFAIFFRRPQCPYPACEVALRGLDASARYEVVFAETYNIKEKRSLTGQQLTHLKVEIGNKPGSMLIRYTKQN